MNHSRTVLGINAFHGDAAACLVVDGEIVAAAEEERFRREKHWAGFPSQAIRYCLEAGNLRAEDLRHVAINRDPRVRRMARLAALLRRRPSIRWIKDRWRNRHEVKSLDSRFAEAMGCRPRSLDLQIHHVEHHEAHLASAFHVSPFDTATVVSVDGFGDFASAAWGVGNGRQLQIEERVEFPHSLGIFYLAMTQYLGFSHYGDEYKVMGMSAYGTPSHMDELSRILRRKANGNFELGLDYFQHQRGTVEMSWSHGTPHVGTIHSPALVELLGPARRAEEPLTARHHDLAASVQLAYERALFEWLRAIYQNTGESRLCLAGGCAMNSLANGKILDETPFEEMFIPPAPGDAGGAVGAALVVSTRELQQPRPRMVASASLGPSFDNGSIRQVLMNAEERLKEHGTWWSSRESLPGLCQRVVSALARGEVVGWFQGPMEWGPRALGQRSILADPRRSDMQEILNSKIKLRESFRPFAPAILREHMSDWFEAEREVPFMQEVVSIRPEKQPQIPAVTHVDGTGRVQTVTASRHPEFHQLLTCFHERTGVPLLLNTSFNENEPVVCTPREALDCFLRTDMDVLVMGDSILERVARGTEDHSPSSEAEPLAASPLPDNSP